eukprot:288270-Prymnesium_polylepis.1
MSSASRGLTLNFSTEGAVDRLAHSSRRTLAEGNASYIGTLIWSTPFAFWSGSAVRVCTNLFPRTRASLGRTPLKRLPWCERSRGSRVE